SDLQVEAVARTISGLSVVASRSQPPYAFGGSHLTTIRVHGSGSVAGWAVVAQWSREHQPDPVALLGLPAPADDVAPFYIGLPDADVEAEKRILSVPPRRFGRHEDFFGLAGPLTTSDELERARAVRDRLVPLIKRAINPPTNLPPHLVTLTEVINDQRFAVNPYSQLVTAATDPAIARL